MSAHHETHPERVRLLTVCTGNICRSPYAAALLREGLDRVRRGAFEVTSAGTHALVGNRMDADSTRLLGARGIADGGFRARALNQPMLREQAVVLAMESRHREVVIDEAPALHRRTFTILAFAAALDAVGSPAAWSALLETAGADDVRSRWAALPGIIAAHAPGRRSASDVPDPFTRGSAAFDRMAATITPAVRTIVEWEGSFPR
ncbi:MAG TPA: low molecular weight phosphatase family protein [Ornithinibacter sp.]|nr:low molecular weight phosphatase family protein [Ornithinibacter sp.]